MNAEEQKHYSWIVEVLAGKLSILELSMLSNKSYRQSQRDVAKVKSGGMLGIKHGNTGRIPKNKVPAELKQRIKGLIQTKYFDFNITHLNEKLASDEGIRIPYETLRKIAHTVGTPKKARKRRRKKAFCLRPRMPREGQLVQFDGSIHPWFFESYIIATLIAGIDDATGKILGAEFAAAEDTFSCLRVMRSITETHGSPQAYYLDQAAHFGKLNEEQTSTQIGRALSELGTKTVLASAPQSKGRVERLWGTLQDRLIAEMRLRGIKRIPAANEYLKNVFIPEFNEKFAVIAREKEKAYQQVPEDKNLDLIFCLKESRKIAANQTFSFDGKIYVLKTKQDLRHRYVHVCTDELNRNRFLVYGKEFEAELAQVYERESFKKAA